jgi:hypothetical protein
MKASHLKTPRTMDEGEWYSYGESIWIDKDHYNKVDRFVILMSVWAFIVLFLIWVTA